MENYYEDMNGMIRKQKDEINEEMNKNMKLHSLKDIKRNMKRWLK